MAQKSLGLSVNMSVPKFLRGCRSASHEISCDDGQVAVMFRLGSFLKIARLRAYEFVINVVVVVCTY